MSLQDEVLAAWASLLKQQGFRKVRGLNTVPFGKDWLGVVGLNLATYNGAGPVDALPVMGVRWKPLSAIFEQLNPKIPKSMTPTLSQPLYLLVPDHAGAQWLVRADKHAPLHLDEAADAVVRWGVPFMESLCDPAVVVEGLRPPSKFVVNPAVARMTYPIALVLTDRQSEAVEVVKQRLQEVADKPDLASRFYGEYAGRFLEKYA